LPSLGGVLLATQTSVLAIGRLVGYSTSLVGLQRCKSVTCWSVKGVLKLRGGYREWGISGEFSLGEEGYRCYAAAGRVCGGFFGVSFFGALTIYPLGVSSTPAGAPQHFRRYPHDGMNFLFIGGRRPQKSRRHGPPLFAFLTIVLPPPHRLRRQYYAWLLVSQGYFSPGFEILFPCELRTFFFFFISSSIVLPHFFSPILLEGVP